MCCEPAKEQACATLGRWSLHRFPAKAIWSKTALLPNVRPRWNTIDGNRKCAKLRAHGVTVSLELRFNAAGEVVGIFKSVRGAVLVTVKLKNREKATFEIM